MQKINYYDLTTPETFSEEVTPRVTKPIYVLLDDIRSLYNVGSIFRTADGAGVRKIYLCGITGTPPRREIHKTALGAEENIPWEYHPTAAEVVKKLKRQGVNIVVLEHTDESVVYYRAHFEFPLCLVVGHEIRGVSEEVIALAHQAIEIPMYGMKQSLNVSVAFGIAIYEIARRTDDRPG